jgi:UDP-N-acetylmuramoyl-tripeptide--D-alanyl-D-alanine ligase
MINKAVPYSAPDGTELIVEPVSSSYNLIVRINHAGKERIVSTNLFGRHNIENIMAAMAASIFMGATIDEAADVLQAYFPTNNRSQIKVTEKNTIFCDSYNANPDSMRKAVESFAEIESDNKIVILGDMLELGSRAQDEHLNVLRLLNSLGMGKVLLVGPVFKSLAKDFGYKTFNDADRLREYLILKPIEKAHILVKGSHGMMLEKIYDVL